MKKDRIIVFLVLTILWGGLGVFALWLVIQDDSILGEWMGWLIITLFASMGVMALPENRLTKFLSNMMGQVIPLFFIVPYLLLALCVLVPPFFFPDLSFDIHVSSALSRTVWIVADLVAVVIFFNFVPPRDIKEFFIGRKDKN